MIKIKKQRSNFVARLIPLLSEERELLQEFFLGGLDLSKLLLYEGGFYSLGSTRAVGNSIYFQKKTEFEAIRGGSFGRSLLIHEATHVWQYQQVGSRYAFGALWGQLSATITTGSRRGAYEYKLSPQRPLASYGYEQQAQLLQDYYLRKWHNEEYYSRLHAKDFHELGRNGVDLICEQRRAELGALAPPQLAQTTHPTDGGISGPGGL
jgi:hypothetical protein